MNESDVEAYAGGLILPSYLSHLRLGPFRFSAQTENRDGQEPLVLTYLGESRLEEFALHPAEHALAMIQFACPGIDSSRIQLPRDDASWHWTAMEDSPEPGDRPENMRIYFAPTTRTLCQADALPPAQDAYVSVSRGHVFIGRSVVKCYIEAWRNSLGINNAVTRVDFATPSAGVGFVAGAIGGQLFLSDEVIAEDVIRFAGLDKALAHVGDLVELDLETAVPDANVVCEDGIYIHLSRCVESSQDPNRGRCPPHRP